jgi:hypothetical protein
LISLCRAYEFILEHLTEFAISKSESTKEKELALSLYEKLTSYNAFLFIHLYRDLAGIMARTTRLLQSQNLQIRDVGRFILNLCTSLKINYSEDFLLPTEMLGDGVTDNVIDELFGKAGKFYLEVLQLIFRSS